VLGGVAYFLVLQVLMPSNGYTGHMPTMPVNNGTTPIQPHIPIVLVRVSAMSAMPTIMRNARSMPPELQVMMYSLL
jgi:hypothetical protein